MMEYFSDWAKSSAVFSRTISSKNSAGQTVTTIQAIDGTHLVGKWIDSAVQTSTSDKFVGQETGRLALDYKSFTVTTTAGAPPVTTVTSVYPDSTWFATINGKKYYLEGVDNVGSLNEVFIFSYRKER